MLHRAARLGDHGQIRTLVEGGADVDEVFEIQLDPDGIRTPATPLMVAAGSSYGASAATLRLLLELGASVAPKAGMSALPIACSGLGWNYPPGGDADRVEVLLAAGADPSATMKNGASALACAASSGDAERVRLLLDAGADPMPESMQESGGYRIFLPFRDPLFMAAESGSAACLRLLLDAEQTFIATPRTRTNPWLRRGRSRRWKRCWRRVPIRITTREVAAAWSRAWPKTRRCRSLRG